MSHIEGPRDSVVVKLVKLGAVFEGVCPDRL